MKRKDHKLDTLIDSLRIAINNGQLLFFQNQILLNPEIIYNRDQNGRTLLFDTVLMHKTDFVKCLIDLGFEVNAKDKTGRTALHYAVIEYQVDIVNLLIINGADVNATDNNGNSIFFAAIFYSKGKGDVINILNTNKANPFLENNNGISALSLAKSITNYNNMQFLNAYLN